MFKKSFGSQNKNKKGKGRDFKKKLDKNLKQQKGLGNIRIKSAFVLVRPAVLNCHDLLNLILLCSFNQSYGYCCSGKRCGSLAFG